MTELWLVFVYFIDVDYMGYVYSASDMFDLHPTKNNIYPAENKHIPWRLMVAK